MSLRIRDILIRDADGAVVAGAPKAEVAVSTTGLLMGSLHAKRVSLVGAELAVRIETDGQITISTGAERRPIAVTPAIVEARGGDTGAAKSRSCRSSSAQPRRGPFRGVDAPGSTASPKARPKTKFSASSASRTAT